MLQAFVCAAQTGNFARAAVELKLTASAVSHQISKLEEWWGVQLFKRHSRGVELTRDGRLLLPVAETFFDDLDRVLQNIDPDVSSPLQVLCTSSLCAAWLTPRIQNLNVTLKSADITRSNLSTHQFDLAIAIGDGHYPGQHVEFLMRDMVFPVCSPALIGEKKGISLADLQRYPMLHRADDHLCPSWEDWYAFHNLAKPINHVGPRFADSIMTINLAAKGSGIALARTALVYEHLVERSLVSISGATMPSPSSYYLICRPGREDEPSVGQLIEWLKSQTSAFLANVANEFPQLTLPQEPGSIS